MANYLGFVLHWRVISDLISRVPILVVISKNIIIKWTKKYNNLWLLLSFCINYNSRLHSRYLLLPSCSLQLPVPTCVYLVAACYYLAATNDIFQSTKHTCTANRGSEFGSNCSKLLVRILDVLDGAVGICRVCSTNKEMFSSFK